MWKKFSIRVQLSILISAILTLFLVITLGLTYLIDKQQRHNAAIELAKTLMHALSQDLLKASLANQTDVYSDLSYRLEKFKSVDVVILKDMNNQPIYEYNRSKSDEYDSLLANASSQPKFHAEDLYVNYPLTVQGQTLGHVVFIIDTKSLTSQLQDQVYWIMIAFSIQFILGIMIAGWISHRYSDPVEKLAGAMTHCDPANKSPTPLKTHYENEFKQLYDGFNTMTQQIYDSTQQLYYQAHHDGLTSLYNRFYIEQQIQQALKDETATQYVLISMDLDHFKMINDAAGMEAGDELLKMIAAGCRAYLPENAQMARVGGDDFYILIRDITEQEGIELAKVHLDNLRDFRFSWAGEPYSISATMGLVAFKPCQFTLAELVKAVDTAFYAAKARGKNNLEVYSVENAVTERFNLELNTAKYIKEALLPERVDGLSRFELFAQAIVPLQEKSDKVGYEILIRLWDSEGNFIPPDNFLPTAVRYQMMVDIDIFVLWTYLETVTAMPEHIEKLHVAHVNLAGASLNNPEFQAKVKEAVVHFNFPWHKLELEVTETSAVGNFNEARAFIQWLKNVGIGLALDDFGTGMSSFEYLKSLPFDVVKIDGSFIKDMHTDPVDNAVIRYIHEIATFKGQETVAEYVETAEDVTALTEIGITYGQGYYLGKPRPLQDWLHSEKT